MGIEYYSFALFIAALICLIAILFKVLFANVKRQHKLLDEKETKLLQLYNNVESIMDEFNDQIRASIDDIKEYESRAVAHMAASALQQAQQPQPQQYAQAANAPSSQQQIQTPSQIPARADSSGPASSSADSSPPRSMTVDSSRIRAASEVLERAERMVKSGGKKSNAPAAKKDGGEVIQRLFDDASSERLSENERDDSSIKNGRRESILALASSGKSHAQIAQELGITQNEVMLVIGLNGSH
ncbi:MAG: hypothetical protein FWH33_09055 [Oscillospiraceae bacterium]|nr:hypothetical protein [Oscillospiraceae bacterium]MCL2126117.1 hypothetical protein [Oscillospiraceae bacterium]